MLSPASQLFHENRKEIFLIVVFPLALSCTAGENNCVTCNADKCLTCYSGFTADSNGVCQGNVLVYIVLLSHLTITYITVLVYFHFTKFRPFMAIDVHEICIFGGLHAAKKVYILKQCC